MLHAKGYMTRGGTGVGCAGSYIAGGMFCGSSEQSTTASAVQPVVLCPDGGGVLLAAVGPQTKQESPEGAEQGRPLPPALGLGRRAWCQQAWLPLPAGLALIDL